MHYHYIPQMPGDGRTAYCEEHVSQSDLQNGMVYVCDCADNTCVVCEEDATDDPVCVICDASVLSTDFQVSTVNWTAHMECVMAQGQRRYGKPLENPQT